MVKFDLIAPKVMARRSRSLYLPQTEKSQRLAGFLFHIKKCSCCEPHLAIRHLKSVLKPRREASMSRTTTRLALIAILAISLAVPLKSIAAAQNRSAADSHRQDSRASGIAPR